MINPDYEQAQRLAMLIPHRSHPHYRSAVHRWAQTLQQAIKKDRKHMTMPDLANRYIPMAHPDYHQDTVSMEEKQKLLDRLHQIEQRLTNLEILVRVQEFSWDDGK